MKNKIEKYNDADHKHSIHSHMSNNSTKGIGVAFFLNFGFCIIEIVGGIYTNSIAIISDAIHDLGDSLSLATAWYLQKYSRRQRNQKYSYGYRRFVLLGAIINSVVLIIGSIFVIEECIKRLFLPELTNTEGMIWLAIVGVLVNGIAIINLKKNKGLNSRVVSLHLLEDVLGWIAILIASIIMFWVYIPWLDPVLSLCISCYILLNIYRNMRAVLHIILQGTPNALNQKEIKEIILSIANVISVHDLHLWSMDGEFNVMSIHIVVPSDINNIERMQLKQEIKDKLKKIEIHHCTFDLESENEICEFTITCCE